jgi:hypothetical protein
MKTNYILIDFESVQPSSLEALNHDHFKLFVFVGANQAKLPFEMVECLQRLGDRARYIKISATRPNALDFHIAYYLGQIAAADPTAYFHVISKDTGFDPLIQHLRTNKILAGRVTEISDIPLVKGPNGQHNGEQIDLILERLRQNKRARPRTVETLGSTIRSFFQKKLPPREIAGLIKELTTRGHLTISDKKVTYSID